MRADKIRGKRRSDLIGDLNPSRRPDVIEKIRIKALGRGHTEETKSKLSNIQINFWKDLTKEERSKKWKENHPNGGRK